MKRFEAREFLRVLVDNLAADEAAGRQFVADPSKLGPLLESTLAEFTLLASSYRALEERTNHARQNFVNVKPRDCVKGIALYLAARFRRRFLRSDAPVWALLDVIDYARFCRELDEPKELDAELQEWLDADLDIFEGVKCHRC